MNVNTEQLSKIFNTLSNPVRLKIYQLILDEACDCDTESEEISGNCVTMISEKLGINQPTVSNHIKELVNAGLVVMKKKGRRVYLFGTVDSSSDIFKFSNFIDKKVHDALKNNCDIEENEK